MEALRRIRTMRGMNQIELAKASGVAQNTISEIEIGKRQARPATLKKLADALGVEIADFFEEADYPKAAAPPAAEQPSFYNHLRAEEQAEERRPTERNIKALSRWLAYNEQRLDEGTLSRDEIAHELDAPVAFEKPIPKYPDEVFDRFMRFARRALEEGKSFDAMQAELADLEADMKRLEEAHAQTREGRG